MKLVVGLGNPGKKYEKTRHNVGFRMVDSVMSNDKFQMTNQVQNPKSKLDNKYNAEIVEGKIDGEKIMLVKPQTYMNVSGETVKKYVTRYKLPVTSLIVIHDDVDLSFGTIRIKKGGGAGGHHGVESVIKEVSSSDFIRVRVGVGKSEQIDTEDYVLMLFTNEEQKRLEEIISQASKAVLSIVTDGLEKAMNRYN